MRLPFRSYVLSCVAVVVASTLGFAPSASAAYTNTVVGPTGWKPDGPVHAVVASGNRVYVGGGFTGGVAALDASTGSLVWTAAADGGVRALALSTDKTRLIVGGGFSEVAGQGRRRLASLNVTNGLPDSWKASAGGTVRDIVVDGNTAYFGGVFNAHNGIAQKSLGAVNLTTGAPVTTFDESTDANVYGLALTGGKLVVAGNFTTVNGQARHSLASITLGTTASSLDSWVPARACTGCNVYWDVATDGTRAIVVGRNAGAATAYHLSTGTRAWKVPANGDAQAVTISDGLVYVGGHFTEIARTPRTILAALNPETGALAPFSTKFVTTYPGIWALAGTQSRLYVGGHFTGAGPTLPKNYPYFAMFGAA